jgi:hypothetical protein
MPLVDLEGFLSDDSIKTELKTKNFPDGKVYTVPSPDAKTGLWLSGIAQLGVKASQDPDSVTPEEVQRLQFEGPEEESFLKLVLGTAYDELMEDGASWVQIQRLGQYAFAYFAVSPEAANRGVEGIFQGKAETPNRATRRSTGAKSPKSQD